MVHNLCWCLKTQVAVSRLPVLVQMFIVDIINQHLDLCLLVWGHGVRLYPRHVQLAGGNLTQMGTIQVQVENVTQPLIHPPSTWPNKGAALINYKWKRCHTLQLWGWLCNCSWHHSWLSSSFTYLKQRRAEWSMETWPLCGCIGKKLRDGCVVTVKEFKLHVIYSWLYDIYSRLSTKTRCP